MPDALNDNELVALSIHEFLRDNRMKCGWAITNKTEFSLNDRPVGEPVFKERSDRFPLGFFVFRLLPIMKWVWGAKFLKRWKPRWRVAYVPKGGWISVTDLETSPQLVSVFLVCDPKCFDLVLELVK